MASAKPDSFEELSAEEAANVFDEALDLPGNDPGRFSSSDFFEDVEAVIEDGFNYFDAEMAFQKTRAKFAIDRVIKTVVYLVVALVVALLGAVGLVVGLIFALAPLITAWGAVAVVVGILLLIAVLLVNAARRAVRGLKRAMKKAPARAEGGLDNV